MSCVWLDGKPKLCRESWDFTFPFIVFRCKMGLNLLTLNRSRILSRASKEYGERLYIPFENARGLHPFCWDHISLYCKITKCPLQEKVGKRSGGILVNACILYIKLNFIILYFHPLFIQFKILTK